MLFQPILAFAQRCYFGAKFLLSNELSARVDICIAFTCSQSDFSLKCDKMKCWSILAVLEYRWKRCILLLVELENKISCSYCGGVRIRLKFLGFDFKYIFFVFAEAGRGIDNWYGFAEVLYSISLKVKLFRWKILSLIELLIESKRIATTIISRRLKEAN